METTCVLSTLGGDPHTQGLFRIRRMVEQAGIECVILPPSAGDEALLSTIQAKDPSFLGLSYRLSPQVGLQEFSRILDLLKRHGLLHRAGSDILRQVALAGLPETMRLMDESAGRWPIEIWTIAQDDDRRRGAGRVLDFFGIRGGAKREEILLALEAEWYPPRIAALDQLAREVVAMDAYRDEPPMHVPSLAARKSYTQRIKESPLPVLRTHFGIPDRTIQPTVEGIAKLAELRVIDEISLGSSDLSQRYFGKPQEFIERKNDGGVPYQNVADLVALVEASRRGNFPSVKPYAHVVELVKFVQTCLDVGMLVGAHQAVPLYWFNELDGRGPMTVSESIVEHIAAVRELAKHGIPVEMNDPNQWSSRWIHDSAFCADYGLISAVMAQNGVRDLVLQMQFNKPRETGDYADLAKMTASLTLAQEVIDDAPNTQIWRETRTGIDSLDPDVQIAKFQLARSTLLQMMVRPHIIHLVSYCEADHIATVEDIVDSSRLVRRAVRVFLQHEAELQAALTHPLVVERRRYLLDEARYLLCAIAQLSERVVDTKAPLSAIAATLAKPDILVQAFQRGYMAAPGIFHPGYPAARASITAPTRNGYIDCLNPDSGRALTERERILRISEHHTKR